MLDGLGRFEQGVLVGAAIVFVLALGEAHRRRRRAQQLLDERLTASAAARAGARDDHALNVWAAVDAPPAPGESVLVYGTPDDIEGANAVLTFRTGATHLAQHVARDTWRASRASAPAAAGEGAHA